MSWETRWIITLTRVLCPSVSHGQSVYCHTAIIVIIINAAKGEKRAAQQIPTKRRGRLYVRKSYDNDTVITWQPFRKYEPYFWKVTQSRCQMYPASVRTNSFIIFYSSFTPPSNKIKFKSPLTSLHRQNAVFFRIWLFIL